MPLTYTDCLNKVREHRELWTMPAGMRRYVRARRGAIKCRVLAREAAQFDARFPGVGWDAGVATYRAAKRELIRMAWDMRAAMRPQRRMAA